MSEKLSPERAVRLLRAKVAALENQAKALIEDNPHNDNGFLAADIALVAQLLADHIERTESERLRAGDEEHHRWQRANEAPTVYSDDQQLLEREFREGFDEGRPSQEWTIE